MRRDESQLAALYHISDILYHPKSQVVYLVTGNRAGRGSTNIQFMCSQAQQIQSCFQLGERPLGREAVMDLLYPLIGKQDTAAKRGDT